ncbi:hypothetical protein AVEN_50492-1 [Araneus ventricosus]|uniref:Uncharacterized protein n=1 Tax=Araneus ventricosus TaxID=182803 RepID=A0A4Y2APY2_ARAVE|nr:hypothetical protein AVEN_50492-1 [Araneus ventricosus]
MEDVMELETEKDQDCSKDGPYTTFASKSFQQPTLNVQMRLKLDKPTLVIHRYGVCNRAISAIASSVIQDLGLILESDISLSQTKIKYLAKNIELKKNWSQNQMKIVPLYLAFTLMDDVTKLLQPKYSRTRSSK